MFCPKTADKRRHAQKPQFVLPLCVWTQRALQTGVEKTTPGYCIDRARVSPVADQLLPGKRTASLNNRSSLAVMKGVTVGTALIATLCLFVTDVSSAGQKANFGNSDISNLLRDRGLVQRQILCVLDQGSCDHIGTMLKTAIPEIVTRNCRSCTPQQAANARKLANFVQSNYPEAWRQIVARYRG
uniref:Uncharacterized protein n=1 Tax=Timema tahoe TaxID=61484 RepID=A0A7R9IHG6_9NEOP|nr:unnamed protein product [Timema tahoe]